MPKVSCEYENSRNLESHKTLYVRVFLFVYHPLNKIAKFLVFIVHGTALVLARHLISYSKYAQKRTVVPEFLSPGCFNSHTGS